MELVLTGRRLTGAEAERLGIVTRVVPAAETLVAALDLAGAVAAQPAEAVRAAVAAVRAAFETPLAEGVAVERRLFGALFGTPDQEEGMRAFLERREPRWNAPGASPTPRMAHPRGADDRRRRTPGRCRGQSPGPDLAVRRALLGGGGADPLPGRCDPPDPWACTSRHLETPSSAAGNVDPLIDDGPADLLIAYALAAGGFDVLANGDHLAAWGVSAATLRDAAFRNLDGWSATAPWSTDAAERRRVISSDTGDGWDASRILLPDVDRLPRGRAGRPRRPRPRRPAGAPPPPRRQPPRRRPGVRPALRGLRPGVRRRLRRGDRPARLRAARRPPGALRPCRSRLRRPTVRGHSRLGRRTPVAHRGRRCAARRRPVVAATAPLDRATLR